MSSCPGSRKMIKRGTKIILCVGVGCIGVMFQNLVAPILLSFIPLNTKQTIFTQKLHLPGSPPGFGLGGTIFAEKNRPIVLENNRLLFSIVIFAFFCLEEKLSPRLGKTLIPKKFLSNIIMHEIINYACMYVYVCICVNPAK